METNKMHSCETCLYFASGRVLDRSAKLRKGSARQYADGWLCTLRPPIADKSGAATEPGRVCALFTDSQTLAQPLRHTLPEPMQPATVAEGEARNG